MSEPLPPPTSSWDVARRLWRIARRRGENRRRHKRELMRKKHGKSVGDGGDWAGFVTIMMWIAACFVHAFFAWILIEAVETSQIVDAESRGLMALPARAERDLKSMAHTEDMLRLAGNDPAAFATVKTSVDEYAKEWEGDVESIAMWGDHWREYHLGGSEESHAAAITAHAREHGARGFVAVSERASLRDPAALPPLYWVFAGFFVALWFVVLTLQGEGIDLDIQKRRHPHWEWLFTHPIRPLAAFSAELLAPAMANPAYATAPVFWFIVLLQSQGLLAAVVGALIIGGALAVAASLLNKAIEIAATLRLTPRRRGLLLGLMAWAGYTALLIPVFALQMRSLMAIPLRWLSAWQDAPWLTVPIQTLIAGWGPHRAWWHGGLVGLWVSASVAILALCIVNWGVASGLQGKGEPGGEKRRPVSWNKGTLLFKKELLWFWRDKSAVVQVVLVPLTLSVFQLLNLRGLAEMMDSGWHLYCGIGIIFGTYLLITLGPRSLSSEGGALWLAVTWPRDLESLLLAKARLWWWVTLGVTAPAFVLAWIKFPADSGLVLLTAAEWGVFSWNLSKKAVTLIGAPSSSGEIEPRPRWQNLAAMIGTLAFGAGVMMRHGHLAILGIVFSILSAAALWQHLRARLPYLFDPWSEKVPAAPTLLHSMIAVAVTVELTSLIASIFLVTGGPEFFWSTRVIASAAVSALAWLVVTLFLEGRGVPPGAIWHWPDSGSHAIPGWVPHLGALLAALGLGILARGYIAFLEWLPWTREYMAGLHAIQAENASAFPWQLLLAAGLAPVTEEWLFRGLLHRSLAREWGGGWWPVIVSSACFAVYHPPVSWVPVFLLGVLCAWLFRKGGKLSACVLAHAVYNLVVILWPA